MRFSALIPVVLGLAALVLSFLALFAGSSKGFMEDYAIVTLNTSRIGENLLNTSSSSSTSSNPVISFIHNVTSSIENDISTDINNDISSLARSLGVHDFYSAHILDYCEGYYTPGPVPNATLSSKQIHENVTSCSNRTAFFQFDPRNALQAELNKSGHSNINLTSLDWPSAIDDGLEALHAAQKATFILYCIAIGLIAVSIVTALLSIFFSGRLSALFNILITLLAFLAIMLASIVVTVIANKATNLVNKYGKHVGVVADKGGKFLAITWVATALVGVAVLVWCFECCRGRGRRVKRANMHEYSVEK